MMYACGALRHDPGEALKAAVRSDMARRGDQYDVRDWLRILWAFGSLGSHPGPLFRTLNQQVTSSLVIQPVAMITSNVLVHISS